MAPGEAKEKPHFERRVYAGLPVVVDRPKGHVIEGIDGKTGAPYRKVYTTDYGYIPRTLGGDGEGLDVFLGPDPASEDVYWVAHHHRDGAFDEYKLMLGYSSAEAARADYLAHYPAWMLGDVREGRIGHVRALLKIPPAETERRPASTPTEDVTAAIESLGARVLASDAAIDASVLLHTALCDLGPSDVATDGRATYRRGPPTEPLEAKMAELTAKERNALPSSSFAMPKQRKYPIHDKAHVQAAESYLEKEHNARQVSDADYRAARRRIASAARRLGVKSKYLLSEGEGGTKKKASRIHIRADLAPGGSLHARHQMSEGAPAFAGEIVPFAESLAAAVALLDEGGKPRLVWTEIGRPGKYFGHPSGPIDLTPAVFEEVLRNFQREKARSADRLIPIDFNHALEQPPSEGSIPERGTPAQGWIHDLKLSTDHHMWGLVEWGELAREYIKSGQYRGISPAFRFGQKDKLTGVPIGTRLSSAALTNQPFMDLKKIAASENAPTGGQGVEDRAIVFGGGRYTHKPGEYMPRVKAVFGLPELSTAAECSDHLDKLRDAFDAVGGDAEGVHQGTALAKYCFGLRDLVGARPGDDWDDDVFDVVQDLIDAAIKEHELRYHAAEGTGGVAAHDEGEPEPDDEGDAAMADTKNETVLLSETQAKLTDVTVKLSETNTKLADTTQRLAASDGKVAEFTAKFSAQDAELTALRARGAELEKYVKEVEARQIESDVDDAIACYSETKGAKLEMKPVLMDFRRTNAASFAQMYPRIDRDKQHLVKPLTLDRPAARPLTELPVVKVNAADLARKIAAKNRIPLAEAQAHVVRMSEQERLTAASQH